MKQDTDCDPDRKKLLRQERKKAKDHDLRWRGWLAYFELLPPPISFSGPDDDGDTLTP